MEKKVEKPNFPAILLHGIDTWGLRKKDEIIIFAWGRV